MHKGRIHPARSPAMAMTVEDRDALLAAAAIVGLRGPGSSRTR